MAIRTILVIKFYPFIRRMSSLTLLDQGEFSDVYIENLYVDNVYTDQSGQITFQDPVYIGNDTLQQYVRNQISTTGALTYNASSGLIRGVTIDNSGHNVTLSVVGTTLSADVGAVIQSKWSLDYTANTLYPAVATNGIVAVNNLVVTGTTTMNYGLYVSGNMSMSGNMNISGNVTYNNGLYVSGGIRATGGLNITGSVSFNNGISLSGNATFNNNVFVSLNGGIGIGQQPFGGVHRLNTKGRIRATAFDATDTSGVLETVSNNGNINYLYTADNGKSYYGGTTDGLNVAIGLSANSNFQVDGSSVHNAGIYVVGGSEINGTLLVDDRFRVLGSATFTNTSADIGVPIRGNQGLFITGAVGVSNKIYSQGLAVSGASSFDSGGLTVTGGNLTTLAINTRGDISLGRNNSATVGRLITISFGTGNAGAQAQGLEFRDLTTASSQCGVYGGQNTLRFYAAGAERMAIGLNVDFSAMPLLNSNPITTDNITEGTSNLYWTQTRFNTAFSAKTTDDLSQGSTNKYFSNTLARQAISALSPIVYNNSSGVISLASSDINYEWKQTGRLTTGDNYFLLATMLYNSSGDGGMSIRGIIGGYENNVSSKFDLTINTRGSASTSPTGAYVTGSLQTYSSTLATIIGRADIAVYLDSTAGVYNIYLVTKNNQYFSYDIVCYGTAYGVTLQTPTTTGILTPVGTVTMASVLSNLQSYSIAGNLGIGTSTPAIKLHMVTGAQATAEMLRYGNGTSEIYSGVADSAGPWFGTRSNHNLRIITNSLPSMILDTAGNVSIAGAVAPSFPLDVIRATDTTIRSKSNSTTGYAQMFVQADGIAGAGLYLNGSAGIAEGGANSLVIKNNMGGVFIRNNGLTGGICITGNTAGNVGINNVNPTYTLDIIDNRPPLSVETTTQYSNDSVVVDSSGYGIFPTQSVTGTNYGNTVSDLSFSGSFPYVNFSTSNEDGSFYSNGTVSSYIGLNGGVGVAVWDSTSNLQFDFSIYIKQINGTATNWIVKCGTAGIGQGIWLNNSRRLVISNGVANVTSTTTLALNTWYRVTAYCDTNPANNQVTLIINGATETLVLAQNSTVWTLHQLGINTTAGFIFYLNNYRLVKGVTSAVQDTNPLSQRSSPVTNYALVRAQKTFTDASMTRGGNFTTSLGNFNGSQMKIWRLIEIVGPSPYADAYAVNTNRFTKTSANERLILHYRFSGYNNTAAGIYRTYFYYYRPDGSYTGYFDFAEDQWYGAAFATRMFVSGTTIIPDGLPAGNYYVRFAAATQIRMDYNDRLTMFIQQGVYGGT